MLSNLPFFLHILIETPAAFSFIFKPETQLPAVTDASRLILRQYGGLLLASNFVCLVTLFTESRDIRGLLGASLGFYHLWPSYRAFARLTRKVSGDVHGQAALGGPMVHLGVHLIAFLSFACVSL
ncbi:hypothetical protein BKA67DRAFT_587088, partial [Truncatella angustata]